MEQQPWWHAVLGIHSFLFASGLVCGGWLCAKYKNWRFNRRLRKLVPE